MYDEETEETTYRPSGGSILSALVMLLVLVAIVGSVLVVMWYIP